MESVNPTPTQVAHPWKATLRTGLQVGLTTLGILVLALPMVQEFVNQFWPGSPVAVFIGGAATILAGFSMLLARIMAIPKVNELLTKIGFGATPR